MLINEIQKSRDALYLYFAKSPSLRCLLSLLDHRQHYQLDLQIILRESIKDHRKLRILESIIKLGTDVYYLNDLDFLKKSIRSFAIIDFNHTYDLNLNTPEIDQDRITLLTNKFFHLRGNSELLSKEYFYKYPVINFYSNNFKVFSGNEIEYFWKVENLPEKVKAYLWVNNQPVDLCGSAKITVKFDQLLKLRLYVPNEYTFTRIVKIETISDSLISFYSDRELVFSNDHQAILYWQATNADKLELKGIGVVPLNGQLQVQLSTDTRYTLTAKTSEGVVTKEVNIKYLDKKQNQFVNIHLTAPLMTEPKTYPISNQLSAPNYATTPLISLTNNLQSLNYTSKDQQLAITPPLLSKLDLNLNTTKLFGKVDLDLNPTKILNNSEE